MRASDITADGAFRFRSKLERRIVRRAGSAIGDFGLIAEDDRLLVAVSGGKDSLALLETLAVLRRRAPVRFSFTAVTVDQGQSGFSTEWLEAHYRRQGYAYRIVRAPIAEVVQEKRDGASTPCALCSRLRRGVLYTVAGQLGCNKIVLGHHLDDLIETLLLNLFFSGKLRAMAPRYRTEDGRYEVIRPLCYVPEAWLAAYGAERRFVTVSCMSLGCVGPDSRRLEVKGMVSALAARHPQIRDQARRALRNVKADHLLDRELVERLLCCCRQPVEGPGQGW